MAELRHEDAVANASGSDSEADHSDDSQGSRNPKKRKRNQKISYVRPDAICDAMANRIF